MFDHVIALVKSLSVGPCGCQHNNSRGSSGYYDIATQKWVPGEFEPGPKTECMRCIARRALDDDGVPYEKDDRYASWFALNMSHVKVNIDTAPKGFGVGVTVTTGTLDGDCFFVK